MNPREAGEQIATAKYVLGILVGYELIAEDLRQRAGTMFARDRDAEAKVYRRLAAEIEAKAKALRKKYDSEDRPKARAAFDFLAILQGWADG